MEKDRIPEYKVDKIGYYAPTGEGKFRPIDIINGEVVFMRPDMFQKIEEGLPYKTIIKRKYEKGT